jgi:hypothetical protein
LHKKNNIIDIKTKSKDKNIILRASQAKDVHVKKESIRKINNTTKTKRILVKHKKDKNYFKTNNIHKSAKMISYLN